MSEIVPQIPLSFDEFIQSEPQENKESSDDSCESIIEVFKKERIEWTKKITELSGLMKKIETISDLMVQVYTERQRMVEYYHYLISLLSKINKIYRKQYADKYDYYTYKSQKRFPNERNKELQILSELSDIILKKEAFEQHSHFAEKTISTIDNIIYGIKSRVEVENMLRGK